MQQTISEKPTLAHLLNRHQLTMPRVAQAARVKLSTVQAMAQKRPLQPALAQQVLSGLFRLTGICYRLEDVDVALILPVVDGSVQVRREDLEACRTITLRPVDSKP